jgi:hypothetical protein
MNKIIVDLLSSLKFGTMQQHHALAVMPVLNGQGASLQYLTLTEALKQKSVTIKEVSEGGSVPDLMVVNSEDLAILLLEGEELIGAKQNRVLNTSILVGAKSELKIPVSCTERGRWSYRSKEFQDSGVVSPTTMRRKSSASAHASLRETGAHRSDQMLVWNQIDTMFEMSGVDSPTSAMKDIFDSRSGDLDQYTKAFPLVSDQRGIIVLLDGDVVGLDIVSQVSAYSKLHSKLVKSYSLEAMIEEKAKPRPASFESVVAFVGKLLKSEEEVYKSVGLGNDHRLSGDQFFGSALIQGNEVIHIACFSGGANEAEEGKRILRDQWRQGRNVT